MAELPGLTQVAVHQVDLTSIIESFHDAIVGTTNAGIVNSCKQAAVAPVRDHPGAVVGTVSITQRTHEP